jgi:phosphohistidine phosphatase
MMRVLMLMRHAKSDWASGAESDFDRPLNARGQRTAPTMAKKIATLPTPPQLILASAAVRARDTAQAVADEIEGVVLELRHDLYGADQEDLLLALRSVDLGLECVLLVGHNPTISLLADDLTGEAGLELRTADLAVLECNCEWSELARGSCDLQELIRARDVAGE